MIVAASSARAALIPALNVQVTADSGNWGGNPSGVSAGGDLYNYTGSHNDGGWTLNWNITVDPDPFINGNVVVTNNTLLTQTFTLNFTLPVAPITPTSLIGGSISGTLTTDGSPGILANSGTESIYTALIDGISAATLYSSPTTVSAPAFESGSLASTNFGSPVPSQPAGPVNTDIAIRLKFTLTAGDSASFTSVFVAQPLPEPTMIALSALAAPLLLRRRRAA